MKACIKLAMVTILITSFGCTEHSEKRETPSEAAQTPVSTFTQDFTDGPTGTVEPVDPVSVTPETPVDYYPDPDPEEPSGLPGTPFNKCGAIFKQANNPVVFFHDGVNLYSVEQFSYDSASLLSSLRFPNDSYSICIDGYLKNTTVFLNTVTSKTAITNPTKLYQSGQYTHELCGSLAYVSNYSGNSSLNLKYGNHYYELTPKSGLTIPAGIPSTSSAITDSNSINACIYSNKASYRDYSISHRPQFEVQAFDVGALNR